MGAWVISHPEEAARLRAERLGDTLAPAEPDAITEAAKKVEGEQPTEAPKPEAATAPTPAKIEEWTTKSAKLKEAFAENPELQGEIMQLARENEAAKPVLDIVSTKEEAEFAVDHANRLVSLQANWMLAAEDPEMAGTAWAQVEDMFKSRDDKGQEIKGADGKVQFDPDYKVFVGKAANVAIQEQTLGVNAKIATLKARLAGNYPSDEAKAADTEALEQAEYAKAALDFATEIINGTGAETALPVLPADATDAQKAFQKKLEAERADLDAKSGKQTIEARKAARVALDNKVGRAWSKEVSDKLEAHINGMKDRNEYIPEFVLNDKWVNPQTGKPSGLTSFGVYCWQQLQGAIFGWVDPATKQVVGGDPIARAKLAQWQAMGAAGEQARQAELTRLTNKYLPKILQTRIKEIQQGIRDMGKKPAAAAAGNGSQPVARVEPSTAATVMPQNMPDGDLNKWAQAEAMKRPEWAGSNTQEREALIGEIYAKKKFFGV